MLKRLSVYVLTVRLLLIVVKIIYMSQMEYFLEQYQQKELELKQLFPVVTVTGAYIKEQER